MKAKMKIINTPARGKFNIVYWGGQQEVKVGKEHDDFVKSLILNSYFAINSERQLIEYQTIDGTFFRVPQDFFFAVNNCHLLTTIEEERNN